MPSAGGTVDAGEELDERMKAISDVLKTKVSEEDRASFQFLFRELQQQKAALQKRKLGSLLANYSHASSAQLSAPSLAVTQSDVIQSFSSTLHVCQNSFSQSSVKVFF